MFNSKSNDTATLDEAIENVLSQIIMLDADSEEHQTMVKQLDVLYKAKASMKHTRVSADTLVLVGGNLLGIGLILGYEKANVITSKALGFVLKTKI